MEGAAPCSGKYVTCWLRKFGKDHTCPGFCSEVRAPRHLCGDCICELLQSQGTQRDSTILKLLASSAWTTASRAVKSSSNCCATSLWCLSQPSGINTASVPPHLNCGSTAELALPERVTCSFKRRKKTTLMMSYSGERSWKDFRGLLMKSGSREHKYTDLIEWFNDLRSQVVTSVTREIGCIYVNT